MSCMEKRYKIYTGLFLIVIFVFVLTITFFSKKSKLLEESISDQEQIKPEVVTNEQSTGEVFETGIKISEIFEKCTSEFTKDQYQRVICLFPYFEMLAMQDGAQTALERAQELKKTGEINDCHLPSHIIGEANLKKLNYDLGKAFATCPLGCFDGCFHGAFEAYADHTGSIDNLITVGEVPEICETLGEDRAMKLQCVHGIGHGMMRHHKTSELLGKVDICKRITNIDYQTGCITGVFMENVNSYLELSEDKLKVALPKICEPIVNSTKYSELTWLCAQEISGGLIAYTGDDLVRAEKFCAVLSSELKDRCIEGLTESRKTFDEDPKGFLKLNDDRI